METLTHSHGFTVRMKDDGILEDWRATSSSIEIRCPEGELVGKFEQHIEPDRPSEPHHGDQAGPVREGSERGLDL